MTKKKNQQDGTMRNIRASNKKHTYEKHQIMFLKNDVADLWQQFNALAKQNKKLMKTVAKVKAESAASTYELRATKKQLDVQRVVLRRHNWVIPVKK